MAKPVQRNTFEAVEEAGWSAGRSALGAVVGTFAAGAAGVYAAAAAIGAIGGASLGGGIGGALGGMAFMTLGPAAGVTLAVAAVVGIGLAVTYGTAAAAIGGALGAVKGAGRVQRENDKFNEMSQQLGGAKQAEMMNYANAMLQNAAPQLIEQGRAQGQQEGAQAVLAQLQQHAQQEQAAEHAKLAHTEHKEHAHREVVGPHTAKLAERSAAAAAAPEQQGHGVV